MSKTGDRPREALGRFAPAGSGAAARALNNPYSARLAFLPIHARDRRWAVVVAHRRAGKTVACINELIAQAAKCPLKDGRYAYIAPQLNQAKDVAWQYLLDYTEFMGPERKTSASELWVELPNNGARIRLYGADNANRLRGLYLDGAVLDEFGDWEPGVWTRVVRPLLTDREGFAIITGTPKGRNGFWRVWKEADGKEGWLQLTLPASRTGLLRPGELEDVRGTLSEEEYAQEYECSFEAAVRGAYWGKEIAAIEAAGQIGDVPMNAGLKVHTAWDLGMADSTVIWLIQHDPANGQYHVIDMIRGEGQSLEWYAKTLEASRERHDWPCPWLWGDHILPHDAAVRELGTGKSRLETLRDLGIQGRIAPSLPVADGIQAVRRLLPNCRFDRTRCGKGIEALRLYRRDFDMKGEEYRLKPVHDWTSHYADAFRMFAVGFHPPHPDAGRRYRRNTGWVV